MPRIGRTVLLSVGTLFATARFAAAQDVSDDVVRELRALRERVQQLEEWKSDRQAQDATSDEIATAVERYLVERGHSVPESGVVAAPRSRRLELGGMIRVRGEMLRRTPQPPDVAGRHTNEFVLGRVRLHARAHIEDDLSAYVELQDARVWGAEISAPSTTGVDLSQGYIDFDRVWGETDVRLGRQAVALSDERFIGALEWANAGRRFDGVTVEHRVGDSRVTGFAYRLAEGFVAGDVSDDDLDVVGAWGFFPDVAGGEFELFGIWVNDTRDRAGEAVVGRPPSEGHTTFGTYGARLHGVEREGRIDWDFQAALQSGQLGGDDLTAWAVRGGLGLKLGDDPKAPRIGVEWNYATGDDDPGDGDAEQFQVLFPTNHGYYGIHDLVAWSNTNSWSVNAAAHLADDVTLKAAYWRFNLAEDEGGWVAASGSTLRPGARGAGRSLGHELDVVLTWKQSERVTWQFGVAHFWAGAFARSTEPDGNSSDSDFLYLQALLTF